MLKKLWRSIKWFSRMNRKVFKWLFLITLPLTAVPIIRGIVNGAYFAIWDDVQYAKIMLMYREDMKLLSEDWSVRGAMSFQEFQDTHNDFHIRRLNTVNWVSKLGFVLPREYGDSEYNSQTQLEKTASLDTLMMDIHSTCGDSPPKDQWLYVASLAFPTIRPWDMAFNSAIQAAYVPSMLNNTRLFYIECITAARFLCEAWAVRPNTLLHFSVGDDPPQPEDIASGLTYSAPLWRLRPVTVRVIEFPLEDAYTGLSTAVFPSAKEQMLAIMRGDGLFEQFEMWDDFWLTFRRFNEHIDDLYKRKGTYWHLLSEIDNWMTKRVLRPLGLEDAMQILSAGCHVIFMAVTKFLVMLPWYIMKSIFMKYLGYPNRADLAFGDNSEKAPNFWENMMGDMLGGFLGSFGKDLEQRNFESAWPEGKITTSSISGGTRSAGSFARTDFMG